MKARATSGDGKIGLAWVTTTATAETLVVSRDDGGVGVGTTVLGLGRLSPSHVSIGVDVAWVLL